MPNSQQTSATPAVVIDSTGALAQLLVSTISARNEQIASEGRTTGRVQLLVDDDEDEEDDDDNDYTEDGTDSGDMASQTFLSHLLPLLSTSRVDGPVLPKVA